MTEPIMNTKPVQTKVYVQAELGVNNYVGVMATDLGAMLGGQVSKGNTYANAEVGYGTAFKAKVEAGHKFSIGKHMGLELTANAEHVKEQRTTESYVQTINVIDEESVKKIEENFPWKDGIYKTGVSAMAVGHSKIGHIKLGVEVGAYSNCTPKNLPTMYETLVKNELVSKLSDEDIQTVQDLALPEEACHQSGVYITPKMSTEINIGKTGFSFVADGDFFGANAGIKYTF